MFRIIGVFLLFLGSVFGLEPSYQLKLENNIIDVNYVENRLLVGTDFGEVIEVKIEKEFENITKKVGILGGENSAAGKEFRGIIRNVDEVSKNLSRRFATAYHVMLKIKRPAVPFLVAGAGIGFLTGFAHNVMKTDFDA